MKQLISYMAIIAMLLTSCGHSKEPFKKEEKNLVQDIAISASSADSSIITNSSIKNIVNQESKNSPQKNASPIDWDKKIIKTADIAVQVKDYKTFNNSIHKNIKNYGAYIASEEQSQTEGGIQNTISIKVPVELFENLLSSLDNEAIIVVQKKISTEDVTGQVIDTKGRIEAKKQVRNRYIDLLKQAKNMKEVLEVQQEINGIQENIESGASRVNYLLHNAAYSTINLRYFQYNSGSNTIEDNPSFFTKLSVAFEQGSNIISNLLLFFITIWPLIIIAIIAWLIFKKVKTTLPKV